jgi:hypothetical protein
MRVMHSSKRPTGIRVFLKFRKTNKNCHSEGAFAVTEESVFSVVETLRYRSHRPEAVSLREGDIDDY